MRDPLTDTTWGAIGRPMAGFGETLRQARAHKGVTLREAETNIRINRSYLAALEDENFPALPPLIYQRGFVRNYAIYLGLDPAAVLDLFEAAHGSTVKPTRGPAPVVSTPPINMPGHFAPNYAVIAFAVVLSAIVFAWGYSIYVTPSGSSPTATETVVEANVASTQANRANLPATPPPPTQPPTQAPKPTATTGTTSSTVSGREQSGSDNQANSEASPQHYETGMSVLAESDIQVTIVVDGTTVYDDMLPAGSTTDQFNGSEFQITTSEASQTVVVNACGDPIPMKGQGEQVFEFQAKENSCPVN